MSYRGPNPARIALQNRAGIDQHAGEAVTWRQYVSASTGNPAAGIGPTPYYAERTITAQFYGTPGFGMTLPETQRPIGLIPEGRFMVTTREPLGRQDELIWRGTAYRVDGDTSPNHIGGGYSTIIKRGDT